jgi:uncharacterized membrane protein
LYISHVNPILNSKLYIRYVIIIIFLVLISVFYGSWEKEDKITPAAAVHVKKSGVTPVVPAASCCKVSFSRGKMLDKLRSGVR